MHVQLRSEIGRRNSGLGLEFENGTCKDIKKVWQYYIMQLIYLFIYFL